MDAELTAMDLTPLLRPRSVAVVGASGRAGSFGQRLLTSLTGWRFPGAIYPVNAGYQSLQDHPCYPDLAALPEVPDCVAFAVSDERIESALRDAASVGVRAAMIFGRGYEAPVAGRMTWPERLGAIAREAGVAVCGNNCMGYISAPEGLRMSANPPPLDDAPGCVGRVGILTLNRPHVLNAFNEALMAETTKAMAAFTADPAVLAIIVRGAGRAFSAGFDMKVSATRDLSDMVR
jgi:acyl-CoA synthetase (NDP forming)